MIKYSIMSFILGFTTNKMFLKDKSNEKSIKCGAIVAIVLILIKLGIYHGKRIF
jgi:hypothetical protein